MFFVLVSNLALVKPEKSKAVENYLIQMARYGQLSGKVCHPVLSKPSKGGFYIHQIMEFLQRLPVRTCLKESLTMPSMCATLTALLPSLASPLPPSLWCLGVCVA